MGKGVLADRLTKSATLYNVLFSSHLHIIAPTPLPWNPLPIPVSATVGGRKTIIPKNQIFKQQGSTALENYYSEEPEMYSSEWSMVCKQQVTTAHNCRPAVSSNFLSPDKKKTEKTTIWRLFNVVLINLFTNLYLRLPDGPGWSPRLNLYWWPSTHPLARALTLHYPEFLGIR